MSKLLQERWAKLAFGSNSINETFVSDTTGSSSWAGSPLNSIGGVGALATMLALADHPSGGAGSWEYSNDFPHGPTSMPTAFNKSSDVQAAEIVRAWKNIIGTDLHIGTPSDTNQGDIVTKDGTNWECKHSVGMTGSGGNYSLQIEFSARDAADGGLGQTFYEMCQLKFGMGVFIPGTVPHAPAVPVPDADGTPVLPPVPAPGRGSGNPSKAEMLQELRADPAFYDAFISWVVSRTDEGCLVSNVVTGDKFRIYWAPIETVRSTFQTGDLNSFGVSSYNSSAGWTRPRYGFDVPVVLGAERVADLYTLATETGDYTPGMTPDPDFFKQERTRFVIKLIDHIISSSSYKYTDPSMRNWWGMGQEPFRAAWLKRVIEENDNQLPDRNMTVTITRNSTRFPGENFEITKKWSSWANKRNGQAVFGLLENDREYSMKIAAGQVASQDIPEPEESPERAAEPMGVKAGRKEINRYKKLKGLQKNKAQRGDKAWSTQVRDLRQSWEDAGYDKATAGNRRQWEPEDFERFAESGLYKFSLSDLLAENISQEEEAIIDEIPEELQYLVDFIYDGE